MKILDPRGGRIQVIRKVFCFAVIYVIASTLLTACTSSQPVRPASNKNVNHRIAKQAIKAPVKPIVDPTAPTSSQISDAVNNFGFNMLRRSSDRRPNTVISPYSVSAILSLTAQGADGETLHEMRETLGYGAIKPENVQRQWAQLNADITKRSPLQKLESANAIWPRKGLMLRPAFVSTGKSGFQAEIQTLDFKSANPAEIVNNWFGAKTHGMIPEMVKEIDPATVLMLANAVYFKGKWEIPFGPDQTQHRPFTLPDGSTVKVQMMSRWDDQMQSVETSSFAMVRLPYEGADSAMYLLLPQKELGVAGIKSTLTGSEFISTAKSLAASAPTPNLILGLPRLDLAWEQDNLQDTLNAMGMVSAFDAGNADFSGIAAIRPLYISQVIHKARIKVGELGTEAAAGTFESLMGGMPRSVVFDRPFLFAIVDEKSATILFLGEVSNPKAK